MRNLRDLDNITFTKDLCFWTRDELSAFIVGEMWVFTLGNGTQVDSLTKKQALDVFFYITLLEEVPYDLEAVAKCA